MHSLQHRFAAEVRRAISWTHFGGPFANPVPAQRRQQTPGVRISRSSTAKGLAVHHDNGFRGWPHAGVVPAMGKANRPKDLWPILSWTRTRDLNRTCDGLPPLLSAALDGLGVQTGGWL